MAKLAALVVAGAVALQALPGLLRAPQPPPLGADVGLPQPLAEQRPELGAGSVPDEGLPATAGRRALPRSRGRRESAATAVIGSEPPSRRRHSQPSQRKRRRAESPHRAAAAARGPAAAPVSTGPPPAPQPEPPPPPPEDGSAEFAPH